MYMYVGYAEYILMEPSEEYRHIMSSVHEKIYLSKVHVHMTVMRIWALYSIDTGLQNAIAISYIFTCVYVTYIYYVMHQIPVCHSLKCSLC